MPTTEGLKGTLNNKTVVVTRPAHQAQHLCEAIQNQGGIPIRFPVLEIAAPADPAEAKQLLSAKLQSADILIFISPNAVERGVELIKSIGDIPATARIAAVGLGSAKKLKQQGLTADIFPDTQFNSEALLAMNEMQSVAGNSILIFRGEGGRELLADTLKQRGAEVIYIECYRRIRPESNSEKLSQQLASQSVDAAVVTSNQGLQNLCDMLASEDRERLQQVQLFVVSDRAQHLAVELGFKLPAIVVGQASDEAIVDSLLQWSENIDEQ